MGFPLPLRPDFPKVCSFPLVGLPLDLPLPLPLDFPLSKVVGLLEELSLMRYVHALCVGSIRRRFAEDGDCAILVLWVKNPGNGIPELRARIFRYAIIRGWSLGTYFLPAKLLVVNVMS
jgi:hypothetical protein